MDGIDRIVREYAEEAEATGWYGPEVSFGLSYRFVTPGQALLDIGIGTGLSSDLFRKAGLEVHGMDISEKMLQACRSRGIENLKLHDLRETPYPYDSRSMDVAVCSGVMNFFEDLSPIFSEASRILRSGGIFAFVTGHRDQGEAGEFPVGPEHTHTDRPITMYRHSPGQIEAWMDRSGFRPVRHLEFTVFLDRERTSMTRARGYVAECS